MTLTTPLEPKRQNVVFCGPATVANTTTPDERDLYSVWPRDALDKYNMGLQRIPANFPSTIF